MYVTVASLAQLILSVRLKLRYLHVVDIGGGVEDQLHPSSDLRLVEGEHLVLYTNHQHKIQSDLGPVDEIEEENSLSGPWTPTVPIRPLSGTS